MATDTTLAGKEVERFHALFDEGRFAQIYAQASQELKNGTPEADCIRVLDTLHRKAGAMQKTQITHWKFDTAGSGTLISLTYRTRYANVDAVEEFDYRVKDRTALLVRYAFK